MEMELYLSVCIDIINTSATALMFGSIAFTTDGVSDTTTTLGCDMPSLSTAFSRQFIAARRGLTDLEERS